MTDVRLDGQWIGEIFGDTPGLVVLELEQEGQALVGTAYYFPTDNQIVPTAVRLNIALPLGSHQFSRVPIVTFHPAAGFVFPHDQIEQFFPNSNAALTADITLTFLEDSIFVGFTSAFVSGFGNLIRGNIGASRLVSNKMNWDDFRGQTLKALDGGKYIYRGQAEPWRLQTTFHRSSKKNLERYQREFIPETYKTVANLLPHKLDLTKPEDMGSFYDTLQHHGYPTPLLDWTSSPFVAAYFAFENAVPSPDTVVRIFAFDVGQWKKLNQISVVSLTSLHLSIVDIVPLVNDRAAPQQSVFTLTNVDDVESYLISHEARLNTRLLTAIDIPTTERDKVLADLWQMGIHHGSLFPGLDGACRAIRLRQFGR